MSDPLIATNESEDETAIEVPEDLTTLKLQAYKNQNVALTSVFAENISN